MKRSLKARDAVGMAGAGAILAGSLMAVLAMTLIFGAAAGALHVGFGFADRRSNRKRGKA